MYKQDLALDNHQGLICHLIKLHILKKKHCREFEGLISSKSKKN